MMDFNIAKPLNSLSDSVLYINYLFTKKAPRIMKEKMAFFRPCYLKLTVNKTWVISLSQKDPVWQENGHKYWHNMKWCKNASQHKWTKHLLGKSIKCHWQAFWKCSGPAVFTDFVVFICNMCQRTNVSEALSSVRYDVSQSKLRVRAVHSFCLCSKKQSSRSWTYLVWPKWKVWANKKNKKINNFKKN